MADASSYPPVLTLRRSAQSGAKAMTAAYSVVYTESSLAPYIFGGAEIDLSTMLVGDIINIRARKILSLGGGWVVHHVKQYRDAQPTAHPAIHIASIHDIYGFEISMQQTAGALRTIPCEFFDAKRVGL